MSRLTERNLIGGHVSTAGGISKSPDRAAVFAFRTFQIFSKNQMQWKVKDLPEDEIRAFRNNVKAHKQEKLMSHASYLLNLGSNSPEMQNKVSDALTIELQRANALSIDYLILHPGSFSGSSENVAISQMSEILNAVLPGTEKTKILIETSAGQGSTLPYKFEQIAQIFDPITDRKKIGVCFDTCHVFAAGYDIKSRSGYEETMDSFNSIIGLQYLMGFHLNDSKKEMGSRVDRHEQIGSGQLGI
ncbi:MAG: deoxyribonuclease IV, partial [Candidatus Thermoplasmatota archaeon]|nr:deoxyribonuclease IV [Candidatus Thermoplasmatota archaeon]